MGGYHSNMNLKFWVTENPGHYTAKGEDGFVHGDGVVFRSTPIRKRVNWGNFSSGLSRIAHRFDGLGHHFYVRVSYGNFEDNFGNISEFYNDGEYENADDAMEALRIFLEGVNN